MNIIIKIIHIIINLKIQINILNFKCKIIKSKVPTHDLKKRYVSIKIGGKSRQKSIFKDIYNHLTHLL
jgi:hypothetical protein